jgi:hypothetical protein
MGAFPHRPIARAAQQKWLFLLPEQRATNETSGALSSGHIVWPLVCGDHDTMGIEVDDALSIAEQVDV